MGSFSLHTLLENGYRGCHYWWRRARKRCQYMPLCLCYLPFRGDHIIICPLQRYLSCITHMQVLLKITVTFTGSTTSLFKWNRSRKWMENQQAYLGEKWVSINILMSLSFLMTGFTSVTESLKTLHTNTSKT